MRSSISIAALLLGAATSTLAQGFFGLYSPPAEEPTARERVFDLPTPFVLGRDNLAFVNPEGVLTVGDYAGNCYTMAWTAKLFREAARFQPEQDGTLDLADLAYALRQESFPGERGFSVPGAGSLHELSGTAEGKAALDPLIATVHYMHYLQVQLPKLVSRIGGDAELSTRHTRSAVQQARHWIEADGTPLVVLWNPDVEVTYGHVVLAYRVVEVPNEDGSLAHTDLYVYDSNVQYGEVRDETIIRVDGKTWRYGLFRKDASSGEIVADGRYDGADWFSGENNELLLLGDELDTPEKRRPLADKIDTSDEQTAYMMAGNRFLERLTEVDPDSSSLHDDLRAFLLDLQDRRRAFGNTLKPELSPDADQEEMDQFLRTNGAKAALHAAPFVLPTGVNLKRAVLEVAGQPRNSVMMHLSVVLEPGGTLDQAVAAFSESALLKNSKQVRTQLKEARKMVGPARITVDLRIRITKGASPDPRLGKWGPRATIVGSRVRLGDLSRHYIPPGTGVLATLEAWYAPTGRHELHVHEDVLDHLVQSLLKQQGVFGKVFKETVNAGIAKRDLKVTLDSAQVKCTSSYVAVDLELHGIAEVAAKDLGYVFDTKAKRHKVSLPFRMDVEDDGMLKVRSAPWGRLNVDDGLKGFSNGLAAFAAELAFPMVGTYLEDTLTKELKSVVALAPKEEVDIERVTFKTAKGKEVVVGASIGSVRLDPAATAKRLGGGAVPLVLESVGTFPDRLMVVFRAK